MAVPTLCGHPELNWGFAVMNRPTLAKPREREPTLVGLAGPGAVVSASWSCGPEINCPAATQMIVSRSKLPEWITGSSMAWQAWPSTYTSSPGGSAGGLPE